MFQGLLLKFGQWLISGGFQAAADAYKAKLAAGNDASRIAAELAARELGVEQREAELAAQYKTSLIGRWYEPVQLLGYIAVAYFGKTILWDKVMMGDWLGGSTDPITGDLLTWFGWIVAFLVGKRGVENVTSIIAGVLRRR
jgi:hypothetical protein